MERVKCTCHHRGLFMLDASVADAVQILPFIAVGFAAQLIDGALGMAFGVISTSLLLGLGVPPAAASAGVHAVETFTTGVSGISHALHRNVNWRLFARLAVPGVIGGVTGAYILSQVDASAAKPVAAHHSRRIASRAGNVSWGVVVGTVRVSRIASGPCARMHTHLVPPSSTPA